VTAPSGANQVRGYEVWRMADALQAQAPVFMKIEYGASNAYSTGPGVWITLGTGSNGSGALTGQVGLRGQVFLNSEPSSTVPYRCLFSGDPGRFGFCMGVNDENMNFFMWHVIERSKDASGADTAEGVYRCGVSNGNYPFAQFLPMTGIIPPVESSIGCNAPGAGTGALGSDVVLYPIYPFNVDMKNPIRGAAGYFKADIPQDSVVSASIYGLTQTFYMVGHQVIGPIGRPSGNSPQVWNGLALRFD
jgi:hypothetical protein